MNVQCMFYTHVKWILPFSVGTFISRCLAYVCFICVFHFYPKRKKYHTQPTWNRIKTEGNLVWMELKKAREIYQKKKHTFILISNYPSTIFFLLNRIEYIKSYSSKTCIVYSLLTVLLHIICISWIYGWLVYGVMQRRGTEFSFLLQCMYMTYIRHSKSPTMLYFKSSFTSFLFRKTFIPTHQPHTSWWIPTPLSPAHIYFI